MQSFAVDNTHAMMAGVARFGEKATEQILGGALTEQVQIDLVLNRELRTLESSEHFRRHLVAAILHRITHRLRFAPRVGALRLRERSTLVRRAHCRLRAAPGWARGFAGFRKAADGSDGRTKLRRIVVGCLIIIASVHPVRLMAGTIPVESSERPYRQKLMAQ
jgi:hypothetical protein